MPPQALNAKVIDRKDLRPAPIKPANSQPANVSIRTVQNDQLEKASSSKVPDKMTAEQAQNSSDTRVQEAYIQAYQMYQMQMAHQSAVGAAQLNGLCRYSKNMRILLY